MRTFKLFIVTFLSVTIYFVECQNERFQGSRQTVSVKELTINSSVSVRYANVLVRSLVENLEFTDMEVSFQVRIPHEAYITSFEIVTNGKTIKASIKEKNAASKEYDSAKENDVSAGTVTQQTNIADDFDRDIFNVKVNVASQTTLEFRLRYEELLKKDAGKYFQKIFIDSDHVIPKLEVVCLFKEKQNFKQLTYQTPTDSEKLYIDKEEVTNEGHFIRKIEWKPSESDQETSQFGFEKPFEIEYELEPLEDGGMVFVNEKGEFVHMFSTACEDTKIMTKQIVFVIDISGSMKNNPIKQVRQTMEEILIKLRFNDFFNLVLFNERAKQWKSRFQQATPYNVAQAKEFIEKELIADGPTNINDALLKAILLFGQDRNSEEDERLGQIVVFLTDGSPTYGVMDTKQIRSNVRKNNYYEGEKCCKSTIHTIAFGAKAHINFLRNLANEHEGKLSIIRDADEDGELLEIYHGIENPFFKHIEFTFMANNEVVPEENITRTQFRQYDCGNEIVVAGWTFPEAEIRPLILASGIQDRVIFDDVQTVHARAVDAETLKRVLVYERVKQLLKQAETGTNPNLTSLANEQALNLSLEYSFVTPVTSLVVTDYSPKRSKQVFTGPKTKSLFSNSQSNSIFPDIQYDADDSVYNFADYTLSEMNSIQGSKTNSANYCFYSISTLLTVLVKFVFTIGK